VHVREIELCVDNLCTDNHEGQSAVTCRNTVSQGMVVSVSITASAACLLLLL